MGAAVLCAVERLEDVAHRLGSQHLTRSTRGWKEKRTHDSTLGLLKQRRNGASLDRGQDPGREVSCPQMECSDGHSTNTDADTFTQYLEAGGTVQDTLSLAQVGCDSENQ